LTRLPFSTLSSFSRLFRDYTESPADLAPFFNGDYRDSSALARSCKEAASTHSDRAALIKAMRAQAAAFGVADESAHLIDKLADPASSAVVTGQQLGLLGGPLYTAYKALSTIQLADHLEAQTGQPVVPVFWLEGEDHDFEEIASAGLMAGDDAIAVTYDPGDTPESGTAVGRMTVSEGIGAVLDDLERSLPPTDFRDELMEGIRKAYAPGTPLIKAFVSMMERILGPGRIAYVSPDDADLKQAASGLFRKELEDYSTSSARLKEASNKLEGTWHAQVQTDPTNLFLHGDGRRTAIDAVGGGFRTRDGEDLSLEDALGQLESNPGSFSPNVVIRPLMQDWLLPTAVYVAGPGEVAYFAQFKGLYDWAGLHMPIIYPRASITLMERRIGKVLEKNQLELPAFEQQVDKLFREMVLDNMETDLDEAFKQASAGLHQAINQIKPVIEGVDRSLVKSTEATRAAFMKEWNQLKGKVLKSEKQQHDVLRGQLERASSALFPTGIPQERFFSPVYFLNKYGPKFFAELTDRMDLDTSEHQILEI
jgi:bacillithiol biosynthesis cysteine-adding enzyme BshC